MYCQTHPRFQLAVREASLEGGLSRAWQALFESLKDIQRRATSSGATGSSAEPAAGSPAEPAAGPSAGASAGDPDAPDSGSAA